MPGTSILRSPFALLAALSLLLAGSFGCNNEPERIVPPSIDGITVETRPLAPGASSPVSADVSDSSGRSLSYEWTVSDSVWKLEPGADKPASATLTAPDTYGASVELTLTVTAGSGTEADTVSDTVTVKTEPNEAPQITGISASPNPLRQGETTTLSARAVDGNDDELAFNWSINDSSEGAEWTLAAPTGTEVELEAPDAGEASATVQLTVDDGYGGETTDTVTITTSKNGPPVIGTMNAMPPQLEPAGQTTVSVSASDPEGDELAYTWSAPDGWMLAKQDDGKTAQVTAPDAYGASATIGVEVSDGIDSTTAQVTVTTRENNGPLITKLDAAPEEVAKGATSNLTVSATDPDGDMLDYRWQLDTPSWKLEGNGTSATLTAPDKPSSQATVTVTVSDADAKEATASVVVSTKANSRPQLASLTADPPRVSPGKSLKVEASASDPDGDTLSYEWDVPKNWGNKATGNSIELTPPSAYGQRGQVKLTVKDGYGGEATGQVTVGTVDNAAPVISSLSASPPQVAPKGTVNVSASVQDPNGDPIQYTWTPPKNWTLKGTGADVTLTAPDTYGVSGTLQLDVSDGHGGTASAKVQVSTAGNLPPKVNSVTANPPVVNPGGTSTIEAMAADPNGDSLTYKWTVPSGWTEKATNAPEKIEVTAPNRKSATAKVQVEVSDGNGGTATAAVVVRTRLNQPPKINGLTANPSTLRPTQKTTVTGKASDADGDSLTYRWKLPKGWSGSSASNTITATSAREYAKTVPVTMEVSDGTDTTAKSVNVTMVANKQPTISSLKVNPSSMKLGQQATATVSASDPYGDSLSYSWSIADNSWSISGSGKSVTLTGPNNKESKTTLKVVVQDGFGGSTSKTVSVEARRALYSFSSHRFTNCGSGGRSGPSLSNCRGSYNTGWDGNSNYLSVAGNGVQQWTVPEDGTYRFQVAGAEGGDAPRRTGPGRGRVVSIDYDLKRGQTVSILVGQKGSQTSDSEGGGGGGGTFVVLTGNYSNASTSDIIAVAGGGGGGGRYNRGEKHGRTGTCGGDGENHPGSGGCNGAGGRNRYSSRVGGGGGGGFSGNGSNANDRNSGGGSSFKNGAVGGSSGTGGPGGFGGGGGGSRNCGYGGGGGGYSGGGGAEYRNNCGGVGGGGGSYLSSQGSNRNTNAGLNRGHGYVNVTKL